MSQQTERGTWGSRLGFILAATGSAIGLGNLWKFPYITHENGGGAFVIVYLISILLIGLPIMVAELLAGKASQRNPWGSFRTLSESGTGPLKGLPWKFVGGIGILAGFLILSYYSVIAGWTIEYAVKGLLGQFHGLTAAEHSAAFGQFVKNPAKQLFYHFVFMGLTMSIVVMGVSKGIEKATKLLMPLLFGILVLLTFYSCSVGAFQKSILFLFKPNFSTLTAHGILEAVGHSFFTLSLGMGAMLTYGSYLKRKDAVAQPALAITFFDTLIALMACLMLYPIIFGGFGLKTGGIGILFTSLPFVFSKMPLGALVAPVFYLLVAFAALSSTISLLEVVVSTGVDERGWQREKATIILGGSIFLFGIPSALCNGAIGWWSKMTFFTKGAEKLNWLDSVDYLASNWLLPVGGMLIALFVGWVMDARLQDRQQPEDGWQPVITISRFFLRFISPVAVFVVLLNKIGLINLKPKEDTKSKVTKRAKVTKRVAPRGKAVKGTKAAKAAKAAKRQAKLPAHK